MIFTDFDVDTFLRDYWQKKPLLIRNPWAIWQNPLSPDELAGLACEPEVESRLVIGDQGNLAVEHGPLAEARFATLGQEPSTLLVQAVDHHVPEVAALITPFRFIPNWRIDDVMVSYATDGGGVGPHYDQYDVFLIQGHGRRRWRVGQLCNADSTLLPHEDLRLLTDFEATDEWLLEPGDILYLPPRFAHDGVAVGDDCMTYSIGFRAPARSELIAHFVDDLIAEMEDDDRYDDPQLPTQTNPGEITAEALAKLHAMIIDKLGDPKTFTRWFGVYNSTPKNPELDWAPEQAMTGNEMRELLAAGATLTRNPANRFSYVQQIPMLLFVDGECFECRDEVADFAKSLCAADSVAVGPEFAKSAAITALIMQLVNQGSLAVEHAH
jgi:50S ribosomal protein L16 3-hydroxylase